MSSKNRVSLLIRGISYHDNYDKNGKKGRIISYIDNHNNYLEYLIDPLKSLHGNIDVFISTYKNDKSDIIEDILNPVECIYYDTEIVQINDRQRRKQIIINMIGGLELIKEYELKNDIKYDNIIVTRFDLEFIDKNGVRLIDFNKFNIPSLMNRKMCDDNFIVINRKNLDMYISALNNSILLEHIHYLLTAVYDSGIKDVNFMYKNGQKFYKLKR